MSEFREQAIRDVSAEFGYSEKTVSLDCLCPSGQDGACIKYAVAQRERVLVLEAALRTARTYVVEHGSEVGWPSGVVDDLKLIDAALSEAR